MITAVRFDRVSRHFGTVRAVDDVSLAIPAGEFFAMLGPSGSGKTTCLRLIAGFEQPDAGHIEIFGATAEGLPPYRRSVNTVFQDYALFPHMSVIENVGYGLMVRGMSRPAREARAREALALVKLDGVEDRRPTQLSGGQRQRVALARALANEPKVLLLDEPTAGINPTLINGLIDRLKRANQELGVTLFVIEHNMRVVMDLVDHVHCLAHGKVLASGSPEQIRGDQRVIDAYLGAR